MTVYKYETHLHTPEVSKSSVVIVMQKNTWSSSSRLDIHSVGTARLCSIAADKKFKSGVDYIKLLTGNEIPLLISIARV